MPLQMRKIGSLDEGLSRMGADPREGQLWAEERKNEVSMESYQRDSVCGSLSCPAGDGTEGLGFARKCSTTELRPTPVGYCLFLCLLVCLF